MLTPIAVVMTPCMALDACTHLDPNYHCTRKPGQDKKVAYPDEAAAGHDVRPVEVLSEQPTHWR